MRKPPRAAGPQERGAGEGHERDVVGSQELRDGGDVLIAPDQAWEAPGQVGGEGSLRPRWSEVAGETLDHEAVEADRARDVFQAVLAEIAEGGVVQAGGCDQVPRGLGKQDLIAARNSPDLMTWRQGRSLATARASPPGPWARSSSPRRASTSPTRPKWLPISLHELMREELVRPPMTRV
jgi:hypothetical protein